MLVAIGLPPGHPGVPDRWLRRSPLCQLQQSEVRSARYAAGGVLAARELPPPGLTGTFSPPQINP